MKKLTHTTPPENFSPKVEISNIFCQVDNTFLLIQRNPDKICGNTWAIPGGKIDDCFILHISELSKI